MDDKVVVHCAVFGECSVFPVTVSRDATVYALQKAVAAVVSSGNQHAVQPRFVTLYLAQAKQGGKKQGENEWLTDDEHLDDMLAREVDPAYKKMRSTSSLTDPALLGENFQPSKGHIQVLVRLGTGVMAKEKKLPSIDLDVHSRVWSSIVRVSSANVCAGTALVVARTATHVYLMTNLYLWTDAVFAAHLSEAFKKELKRYAKYFDYAIFAVPVKPSVELVACRKAVDMRPTMDVSVVGFLGAIQEDGRGPSFQLE